MMHFLLLIISFFTLAISVVAQTGPGGVGNSATNGLWLRADDIVDTNNTTFSSWADASGNGNDANQSNGDKQPIYLSTSSINGMPVVRLDGTNDQLIIDDVDILDGSSSITFYTVIRPNNLNGSPRGILGKRITFGNLSNYAYTWFFWSGNRLNHDLHTQNDRYTSGSTTFSNANNYILNFQFDGSLPVAERSSMRSGSTEIVASSESSSTIPNSNQDLVLGALNVDYGTYLGADYAEVIHFNYALDTIERIFVENYLSAKYDIAIVSNDIYDEDDAANGDYDYDVAGIGRISPTILSDEAQGSGLIRVSSPTNLDDDEFLFWGHDNGDAQATNNVDVPVGVDARFERLWRVSEVNSAGVGVDVGDVNIQFDLSGLGVVVASDLVLLVDTDNDGVFSDETPISGATSLGGTLYQFAGVSSLADNLRFTIGTIDVAATALPVELLSFSANLNEDKVELFWETSSEINNDFFTVERSVNGVVWEQVVTTSGAGNSNQLNSYIEFDFEPIKGLSYYRLKQTDFDGTHEYFNIIPVRFEPTKVNVGMMNLFPSPISSGEVLSVEFDNIKGQEILVVLRDISGKELHSKVVLNIEGNRLIGIPIDESTPKGTYLVIATSEDRIYSQKLIVK